MHVNLSKGISECVGFISDGVSECVGIYSKGIGTDWETTMGPSTLLGNLPFCILGICDTYSP